MRLTEEEITKELARMPKWVLGGKKIRRRYKFAEFKDGIAFVNKAADVADKMNHHPFISIDYKFVTLELTSWHAGGLTEVDFEEARNFDAIYGGGTTV